MKKKMNPFAKSEQDTIEILKLRAEQLAQKKVFEVYESDLIRVVAFQLAQESYGIELEYIRAVVPLKELTFVPGAPDFILGIINMRGEIISIVDFKKLFDLPRADSGSFIQIIILQSPDIEFGIQADQVYGVKEIEKNEIQPSLPTLTGVRMQYLKGVTGDGMVILDGEKILSDKKMRVHIEESS